MFLSTAVVLRASFSANVAVEILGSFLMNSTMAVRVSPNFSPNFSPNPPWVVSWVVGCVGNDLPAAAIWAGFAWNVTMIPFASISYSGGLMPCVRHSCSIFSMPRPQASMYLRNWLEALKNDRNYIFKAAKQASKVCDFLLAFVKKPEPEAVKAMQ